VLVLEMETESVWELALVSVLVSASASVLGWA
jgi:hypothetical protein